MASTSPAAPPPAAEPASSTTKPARARICVYCGSSAGTNPVHLEAARELARSMAAHDIDLVYGGGTVGLMGEVAKTLVSLKGPDAVHGIIPEVLVNYERDATYGSPHPTAPSTTVPSEDVYGRTTVVEDMHTRKQLMVAEVLRGGPGSGFIALSGGFGTLEEVMETTTWNQLGIHDRGVVLLNVDGFWDGLVGWVERSVQEGFIRPANGRIVVEAKTAEEAIRALKKYKVSPATLKLEWGKQ